MTIVFYTPKSEVPLEAFTTFGVSAKPNSSNPIGFFGTGLKYAVAVTLRLGGRFRLYVGGVEYEFYTKEADFRGTAVDFVRMRKRKTFTAPWSYTKLPFTLALGKTWKAWQAVRELESNTRDEGGDSWLTQVPTEDCDYHGRPGTSIVIECTEMEEEYEKLDQIFRPEMPLIYEDEDLKVFDAPSKYVFYRGLRVHEPRHPSLMTYDFKRTELTEDRTLKYSYYDMGRIRDSLLQRGEKAVIDKLLDMPKESFEYSLEFDMSARAVSPSTAALYSAVTHALARPGASVPPRLVTWHEAMTPKKPTGDVPLSVTAIAEAWHHVLAFIGSEGGEMALEYMEPQQAESILAVVRAIKSALQIEDPVVVTATSGNDDDIPF